MGGARGGGGGGGNGSWVARDSGSQAGRAPVDWHGAQLAGDVGGAGMGRSLRMKMRSRVLVGETVGVWVGEGHHSCGLEEQKGGCRWSCVWMMMMKRRSKVRMRYVHSWSHMEDLLESGPWHLQHLTCWERKGCYRKATGGDLQGLMTNALGIFSAKEVVRILPNSLETAF